MRFRHVRRRPQVSASLTHGEELGVTVHGRAAEVDLRAPQSAAFRDHLTEVYGKGWLEWGGSAPYARIEPPRCSPSTSPNRRPERLKQEAENLTESH